MSKQRNTLGRNLNALLGVKPVVVASSSDGQVTSDRLRSVPIELLKPGQFQPRKAFEPERLQELADSIKAQGIIQPIVIRPIAENEFEIVAGERRWRAAQLAGLAEVPVVLRELSNEAAMAVALIENIQREDLNPMEEARALQRLLEEFGFTHQQVADTIGKSRTTITNLLRLHNLHEEVKTLLEHGDIEMGHARALLSLDTAEQPNVAHVIVSKSFSVRATESYIRRLLEPATTTTKTLDNDPDITRFQENLSRKLGAKLKIQHNTQGNGKLIIHYNSIDELEGILSHVD